MSRNTKRVVGSILALIFVALFFIVGREGANTTIDNAQATASALQNTVNELVDAPRFPDLSGELADAQAALDGAQAALDGANTTIADLSATLAAPTATIAPTEEPTEEPTAELTTEPTAEPTTESLVIVLKAKLKNDRELLREVCYNKQGFTYNAKGFPIISDCIYPKGTTSGRIKYFANDSIQVEKFGDAVFAVFHGFETNKGKALVKADGGLYYFVAVQRGADGQLLFINSSSVKGYADPEQVMCREVYVVLDDDTPNAPLVLWDWEDNNHKTMEVYLDGGSEIEYSIGKTFSVYEYKFEADNGYFYKVYSPDQGLFVEADRIKTDPSLSSFPCGNS